MAKAPKSGKQPSKAVPSKENLSRASQQMRDDKRRGKKPTS
jgi:hypothetical protein